MVAILGTEPALCGLFPALTLWRVWSHFDSMQPEREVIGRQQLKWLKKPEYGRQIRAACERANLAVKQFGRLGATLKRARAGLFIGLEKHDAILELINRDLKPPVEIEYPWRTDGPSERDNWDAEKMFQAFSRSTVYKSSIQQAEEMFKRCYRAKQFLAAAHWADHAAGEYRKLGNLKAAMNCLDDCFRAVGKATKPEKSSVGMRLLLLRARFERAMTRDYEALGEFRSALGVFAGLDADVDEVLTMSVPKEYQGELGLRKIHHKRQRAEMHRLLGEYGTALRLMEEAIQEYPEWADEPRRFGRLHRADSLRLLGRAEEALADYDRLEATARNRHMCGFLAAVLWPKVGACQGLKSVRARNREVGKTLGELSALVDNDANCSRYSIIYSRLVRVPSVILDVAVATKLVDEALGAGPLEADCFRTEYAHAMLCRGEIERGQKNKEQAEIAFREALRLYEVMEMRWGVVRSIIGLNLVAARCSPPADLKLEGCDAAIWARFQGGGAFPAGSLCENLP